jgi:UDP-glucose 4-epimerase
MNAVLASAHRTRLHGCRVLVTGGSGYIGGRLCTALAAAGAAVTATSRAVAEGERGAVRWVRGDLTSQAFTERLLQDADPEYVFHLAAYKKRATSPSDFRDAMAVNYSGLLNLVSAASTGARLRRFIAMGTCEEYGPLPAPFRESAREMPGNAYGVSKLAATHLLQTLHRTAQFPAVVLRPSLAYGPGQADDMMLPALIRNLIQGRPFAMTAGAQTRDFVYIDDVIEALLLAATAGDASGQVINISSGEPVSVRSLALRAAELVGANAVPLLGFGQVDYRPGEAMNYWAAPDLAHDLLSWKATTPLETGLEKTVAFYRHQARTADAASTAASWLDGRADP